MNRLSYPPVRMVMTLDGKQILTEVVEGNIDYQYAHGESMARVKVTGGGAFLPGVVPGVCRYGRSAGRTSNTDGRRKLFIDYVDIVGRSAAAAEKPDSRRRRLFVCEEQTRGVRERILGTVARRAYRRPVDERGAGRVDRCWRRWCGRTAIRLTESIRVALAGGAVVAAIFCSGRSR